MTSNTNSTDGGATWGSTVNADSLNSYYDDKEHEINGIIYLDYYPVNSGKIIVRYPVEGIKEREVDIDKYKYIFIERAKIYANDGSEIYKEENLR